MANKSSGWVSPDNESTNIAYLKWDEVKDNVGTLLVEFKSKSTYQYKNVPKQIFKDFKAAESAGSYLHKYIRGVYQYEAL